MGRPSGLEPDLPGPRPGVLPLSLRPPWSTRRGSNPQPSVCKTAAQPVELLVGSSGTLESNQVSPRIRRVPFPSGSCPSGGTGWARTTVSWASTRRLGCLSYGPSIASPRPFWRSWPSYSHIQDRQNGGGCLNGTWVLPPLLLVG